MKTIFLIHENKVINACVTHGNCIRLLLKHSRNYCNRNMTEFIIDNQQVLISGNDDKTKLNMLVDLILPQYSYTELETDARVLKFIEEQKELQKFINKKLN